MTPFNGRNKRIFVAMAASGMVILGGCGGDDVPGPKKIDVAAQVAALKGDGAAKEAALVELGAGGRNASPAVNDIIPLLKDPDPVIRRLAANALGQIGPAAKAAIPDIQAMMSEPDPASVTVAVNAVRLIDPKNAPTEKLQNVMSK